MNQPARPLSTAPGSAVQGLTAPPAPAQAPDMNERLRHAVAEAHTTVLRNAPRLCRMAEVHRLRPRRPLTEAILFRWLAEVEIELSPRMNGCTHGLAYPFRKRIAMSPVFVRTAPPEMLLDMLLHELGHCFAEWFFAGCRGHDRIWQLVGFTLGYVPVGCTEEGRRHHMWASMLTYRMAASGALPHPELGF
jgi:predicted SprT family Zn-dependent metalloprotease